MNKVSVYGGLGNQMFQYAMVVGLRAKGVDARISFRDFFLYHHHHGFELPVAFQLDLGRMGGFKYWLLKRGSYFWKSKIIKKLLVLYFRLGTGFLEKTVVEKKEFYFDEDIYKVRNSRLVGTWQSIKYFPKLRSELRDKLKFNLPTDSKNLSISEQIQNSNAVAVHIRRGDYTNEQWKGSHMVFKSLAYYSRSIEFFSRAFENPIFYFFSDDMDWVKSNFKGDNFKYVEHNQGSSSYIDMYLMSLCSGFIIANSTFSWWAAWLSEREKKHVIMPETWINGMETPGVFPKSWCVSGV